MVIPQIEPEKFKHSIHEIYVGKSKDTLDCVGVHSLGVKEVTGMFGHFIKYRVKAEQVQEPVWQPVSTSAFAYIVHQRVSVHGMTLKSSTHSVKAVPRKPRFLM